MKVENTYTEDEILGRVQALSAAIDLKKRARLDLSQSITELKKQVIYWESLSLSQTKMF